jgi:hypothetical protein
VQDAFNPRNPDTFQLAWNLDEAPFNPFAEVKNDFLDWFFKEILKNRGKGIADEDRNRYLISAGVIKNRMLTNAGIYDEQILRSTVSSMKSSEISWLTGLSKPTVLQHLKKLKELDLINNNSSYITS